VTVLRGILLIALLLIHSSPLVGAECAITPDANGLVIIPASQTSIAYQAFYQCGTLKTVSFAANSLCTTIGSSAFNKCMLLATVSYEANSALTTIAGAAGARLQGSPMPEAPGGHLLPTCWVTSAHPVSCSVSCWGVLLGLGPTGGEARSSAFTASLRRA